jgi:hypothetical protein
MGEKEDKPMKRALAAALLVSAATYGILAGTGLASRQSHQTRYVSVRPGTYVRFVKLD